MGVRLLLLKHFADLELSCRADDGPVSAGSWRVWFPQAELEQDHKSFVAVWVFSGMTRFDADVLVWGFLQAGASSLCAVSAGAGGGHVSVDAEDFSVSSKPPCSLKRGREAFPAAVCIAL